MKKPKKKPVLKLTGIDGNAYSVMGHAVIALRKAGADEEYIQQYKDEATSGDYSNLLRVTMDYVSIE